jgi:hypothetical protein
VLRKRIKGLPPSGKDDLLSGAAPIGSIETLIKLHYNNCSAEKDGYLPKAML